MHRYFKTVLVAGAMVVAVSQSARADEVSDTIKSALAAYEEGDIQYALEELEYAKGLLAAMKTDALTLFLPQAPEGWTREISTDISAGLAMIGGGSGVEATYSNGSEEFTITIMVNSPMAAMMGGMLANAGAMGLEVKRVGRQKFVLQDGELSGLVGTALVQASGADAELMLDVLKDIDFKALKDFGQ